MEEEEGFSIHAKTLKRLGILIWKYVLSLLNFAFHYYCLLPKKVMQDQDENPFLISVESGAGNDGILKSQEC